MSYLFKINPQELLQLEEDIGRYQFQYDTAFTNIVHSNVLFALGTQKIFGSAIKQIHIDYVTKQITFVYVLNGASTTTTISFSQLDQYTTGDVDYLLFEISSLSGLSNDTLQWLQSFDDAKLSGDLEDYDGDYIVSSDLATYGNGNNLIRLYFNTSKENEVRKELILNGFLTGDFTNAFSLMTPVLDLQVSLLTDIRKFNYVYIDNLDRYYFVRSISSISKDLTRYSLEIDVLMTYQNLIYSQTCFVTRNATNGSLDIADDEYNFNYNKVITTVTLSLDSGVSTLYNVSTSGSNNFVVELV